LQQDNKGQDFNVRSRFRPLSVYNSQKATALKKVYASFFLGFPNNRLLKSLIFQFTFSSGKAYLSRPWIGKVLRSSYKENPEVLIVYLQ